LPILWHFLRFLFVHFFYPRPFIFSPEFSDGSERLLQLFFGQQVEDAAEKGGATNKKRGIIGGLNMGQKLRERSKMAEKRL
jgi:hypothetical protein